MKGNNEIRQDCKGMCTIWHAPSTSSYQSLLLQLHESNAVLVTPFLFLLMVEPDSTDSHHVLSISVQQPLPSMSPGDLEPRLYKTVYEAAWKAPSSPNGA